MFVLSVARLLLGYLAFKTLFISFLTLLVHMSNCISLNYIYIISYFTNANSMEII